ncbi:MAG: TIGR00341 family protein [Maritimibacter sp.]
MAAVCGCLDDIPADHWHQFPVGEDGRQTVTISLDIVDTQAVLDKISDALDECSGWHLYTLPVEASLPETRSEDEAERIAQAETAQAREEIYAGIRKGTALTLDYLVLTGLATVVAAIGLSQDQVAVVIGAMVIAPLLGPILAFAFATTLGTVPLMLIALRALGAGLGVATLSGVALGLMVGGDLKSGLLDYSGALTLIDVVLPLASGAAAALMVASGQTSALVGVMVAAALLPPLAAFGLLLGGGDVIPAARALGTVIINIAAINLAAQVVFRLKGIRPRKWDSAQHATSVWTSLIASAFVVFLMALAVYGSGHGWMSFGAG